MRRTTCVTWSHVSYISGDTWNVNPIALQRVERAVLPQRTRSASACTHWPTGRPSLALVPVAAILVASIRLHCLQTCCCTCAGPGRTTCLATHQ